MSETTHPTITLADLRSRRDEILRLAEKYNAYNVRVFGSVARGEATPESDVDVIASFREGTTMFDRIEPAASHGALAPVVRRGFSYWL